MAITAADLFKPTPDSMIDFTGVSPATIFNRSVIPRTNEVSSLFGEQDGGDAGAMASGVEPPQSRYREAASRAFAPEDPDMTPERVNQPMASAPPTSSPPVADPMRDEFIPTNYSPQPDDDGMVLPPKQVEEDYNAAPTSKYNDYADFMFESEARMQNGKLAVYTPPEGDGGGAYEVAGITERFQPKEAGRLKSMIDAGRNDEAVAAAKDFYRQRAAPYTGLTGNKGLQLQLADTVHHRGEGGLRNVLQRATGSDSQDYAELVGQLDKRPDALDAFHSARQQYEWEDVDRGRESRKKFRKGLQNRFNRADAAARQFL